MLVLTRQLNETIVIGDDVEVKIVDIRGDKIRLGITAPRCITVHRGEIYAKIKQQKEESDATSRNDRETYERDSRSSTSS